MDSPVLPHLSIHLMICEFKAVYSNILLPPGFKRGISPCYLMIISLLTGRFIFTHNMIHNLGKT